MLAYFYGGKDGVRMSGITGWIDFERVISDQTNIFDGMTERLRARGPDSQGTWVSKHVLLGHCRLIVMDPEGGFQPMMKQIGKKRYVITYDGEIYNFPEIRSQLITLGYSFETQSDTEVLLTAYAEWKENCLNRLNGNFAFAIWDEAEQKLFLARDRLGVKPLFYAIKGSTFLFASELKALLAHPEVPATINEEGLAEVLVMGPARTPGCGIFQDIDECKPATWLQVDRKGVQTGTYWSLVSQKHPDGLNETVLTVRDLFFQAVKKQLISDVPIGAMLSGGLDSSAVSACVSQIFREEDRGPLGTFSVDYEENDRFFQANEFQPNADAPWIERMVQFLQTHHQSVLLPISELIQHLSAALSARDCPGMTDIDASMLLFCKAIKQKVTVVFSGEGADEVFGGYPWFHRQELVACDHFPWARLVDQRVHFLRENIQKRIQPIEYARARYQEALAEVPRLDESPQEARIRELFYLNLTRWMPTLLDRKDRMCMAVGVSARVPFCDNQLIEYVWNIPWQMKTYGNREKGILRAALKGWLPEDVLKRKKSPFPKTHHPLYLKKMVKQVNEMLDDPSSPVFEWIDPKRVRQFVEQDLSKVHLPWFGQLMNVPQLLAYFCQINEWIKKYNVNFK